MDTQSCFQIDSTVRPRTKTMFGGLPTSGGCESRSEGCEAMRQEVVKLRIREPFGSEGL